ncbi:hypothetical protein GGD70_007818 [Paraburkholderia fungorum]|nr:hypothetical protein [Paraburkholderia fungorum]
MPALMLSQSAERLPLAIYLAARSWLLANDPDAARMISWSLHEIRPPQSPEAMAGEIIWIILCAGRSAQAARTIEAKVWSAIRAGKPVVSAFGYRAKAAAIERAWREREADFAALQNVLAADDPVRLLEWCHAIPFVGDDTQYQLAKNFGVQVCKPDIWLCRLSGFPDRPRVPVKVRFAACMALCGDLARGSGDTIAVVDSMLWLACNKGVLVTDCEASPVTLNTGAVTARSIYKSAPQA